MLVLIARHCLAQAIHVLPNSPELLQGLAEPRAQKIALLEKLNRVDAAHIERLPMLVVPSDWNRDELDYSPLPKEHAAVADAPKFIVVNRPAQVFGAYEYGKLVHWGPISSAAYNRRTKAGLHHLNYRSKGRNSTVDSQWYMPWYFNFDNREGIAFHEYLLPGLPASHGCVRLLKRDAMWIYGWGEQWKLSGDGREVMVAGTPVLILGEYDFKAEPPWRQPSFYEHSLELPVQAP